MEPSASCLPGFFMVCILLKITVLTQVMSLDIQINTQIPDTEEGVLVECTAESLFPPAEMTWRDSKGNIIPPSSTFDSQDRAGLLCLKSTILLKNRTEGPITCSIYNKTTNQEKRRSIILSDVLFRPQYMSLMSNNLLYLGIYLIFILFLNFLKGILFCLTKRLVHFRKRMIKIKKVWSNKTRACCPLIWEFLEIVLFIAFLPLYLMFRIRVFTLDEAHILYNNWLWKVCKTLIAMMILFTVLILFLLWTLNRYGKMPCLSSMNIDVSTHDAEQNSSKSAKFQENYDVAGQMILETYEETIFCQHQESCEEIFNLFQTLRLNCTRNLET
ncbi:selection and upkeep of intraepithelial T-cells protein 11 isoform X1 [Mus musculus]|uniref:selection and upkeep of intraepithelial T-cells protein 11 isoform X1 n=1 Tax=Mus musculus TaxID=10090 RepID=UPI0003D77BCB|nr:selection and upkeep of intraepithelial T-cells protein 11 isoform X1 [Mus musculus]|eukprot:XP_006503067.1 PREDICTED: selection and upkeep of intraepithelial T-cells protein 11 isoform X1 [Mus musculus]